MQAQEAATSLAAARDQPVVPEHLLIALLDQGTPEVTGLLSRAGLDPAAVRRAALAAIGAPASLSAGPRGSATAGWACGTAGSACGLPGTTTAARSPSEPGARTGARPGWRRLGSKPGPGPTTQP
jgi:hypothetical protein